MSCNSSEIPAPNLLGNGQGPVVQPGNDHVSWSTSKLPLDLKISKDFDPQEISLIEDMANEWEIAVNNEIDFYITPLPEVNNLGYSNLDNYQDNEMGIYKSENWFSNIGSFVLALTQYFGIRDGSHIDLIHGDIVFNYRDHDWSLDGTSDTYDLPSVAIHEIGHLLGLFHQFDFFVDSVMHPSIFQETIKRNLYENDILKIQENYGLINSQETIEGALYFQAQGEKLDASARTSSQDSKDGELVRGVIEMRVNGECHHYQGGKLVHLHYWK